MHRLVSKGFAIFLMLIIVFSLAGCTKKEEEGLKAKVDGNEITEEEFNTEFNIYKTINEQQLGEGAMDQVDGETGKTRGELLEEQILEMLIMERLIEKEAKENNIEISEEEVQQVLEEYILLLGGEENFDQSLEANQLSKDFVVENLKRSLLMNKHKENFIKTSNIDDKELKEFYDENKDELVVIRASHILVKTEEEGKEVLERLSKGEEFAELAKEISFDKTSGILGGDLGYFGKGKMIAEFEEAAFALDIDETSDLVKTEVGYHIIRVLDKKVTFESLKDDISEILGEQKYFTHLQEMRENAKVKIF